MCIFIQIQNQILFKLFGISGTLYALFQCFLASRQWFDQVQRSFVSLTDRHTLWRCLQSTVTPTLAGMLEVMDRYANLDLLSDGRLSQGPIKLWLDILADSQILDLTPLQNPRYGGFCLLHNSHSEFNQQKAKFFLIVISSESDQEVLVQHYFMLDGEEQPCAAAFSWLIRMHLESLWEESEFMPGLFWSQSFFVMTKCLNSWRDHEVCTVLYGVVSNRFFLALITDLQ